MFSATRRKHIPRASVADVTDSSRSSVIKALSGLAQLLENWGPGSQHWRLLQHTATDAIFQDDATRKAARREALQLSAGISDQFEIRLSLPPYSLVCISEPGSTPEDVEDENVVIDDFLDIPIECCSPLAASLRRPDDDRTMVKHKIHSVLPTWKRHAALTWTRANEDTP